MSRVGWNVWLVAGLLGAAACGTRDGESRGDLVAPNAAPLQVSSSEFGASSTIPKRYTCEDDNESPPLSWSDEPGATKTFAVVVEDPDAPGGTFVHWIVYDLPASVHDLSADAADSLPGGAEHGKNSKGEADYAGACPPKGRHRYIHKVYALDTDLDDLDEPDKAELERAMKGHVLAVGQVIGTYEKTED